MEVLEKEMKEDSVNSIICTVITGEKSSGNDEKDVYSFADVMHNFEPSVKYSQTF